MKKTLLLFLLLPFFGIAQTVDLASWSLTADGNTTAKQTYVQSSTISSNQNRNSYGNTTGAIVTGWDNSSFEHYRFIESSIPPTAGNVIWVSNFLFQQASSGISGAAAPTTYIAKYYISENGNVPGTYDFFYNTASSLVAEESIAGNPSKNIKINQSLNSNQKLIIRLYTKASDYNNAQWQILANSLKFTGKLMAPLSGPYVVGNAATADFSTLTSAVNALNNVGVSAAVTFLLDNTDYNRSTNEVFPLNINPYFNNTTYKVTFKPNTGKTVTIEASNLPSTTSNPAVFKLNGVDNVVFDGSNNATTSKNLTIYNNNPINPKKSVIWIASENATNGASNNEIKNLTLKQYYRDDDLSVGVFAGGTSSVGSIAETANSNNTVQNVTFTKVGQPVYVAGLATSLSANWKIQNNTIGGTTAADKPFLGVYLSNAKDYEISGNTINGVLKNSTSYGPIHSGIIINGTSNGNIFNNTINDVNNSVGNGYCTGIYIDSGTNIIYNNTISNILNSIDANGIYINTGSNTLYNNNINAVTSSSEKANGIYVNSASNIIYNNKISAIVANKDSNGIQLSTGTNNTIYSNTISNVNSTQEKANGLYVNTDNNTLYNNIISNIYSKKNSAGINQNNGSGTKIYYNTIVMNSPSAVSESACLYIAGGSSLGIKNNIFYSSQATGNQYLINSVSDHTAITEFNSNDYYLSTSTSNIQNKLSSGTYTTLTAWKGISSSKEQSSIVVEPKFISTVDFHLAQNTTNSGIHAKGLPITGITTDIDGETRSTTTPDMGADEIIVCEQGDQVTFGVNSWIGYVYKWSGATPNPAVTALPGNATTVYIGNVTESPIFDRNMGNGAVSGATTNICGSAPSDNFFIRYKMKVTTVAGIFNFSIGGDDGARLYIDGNTTPAITRWNDHSYTVDAALVNLTAGVHEFVLEYYENAGAARATFSYGQIKGDNVNLPYGINTWNVYGFTKNNLDITQTVYAGTYVDSNVNIVTTNSWAADKSPSIANGYQGAPMPIDYFTTSHRRQGFPCGNYQIQLANYDDDVQIYVNGILKFPIGTNKTAPQYINSGEVFALNKDSKVEVRLREDAGDAKMTVNFVTTPVVYNGTGTPPTNTSAITIASNTTLQADLEVCSCTVNPGVTLTVPSNKTLTVNETITVGTGGKLLLEDGASLLQTSTATNAYQGPADSFVVQRNTDLVKRYDFTYWSSPITRVPKYTMHDLSPNTLLDKFESYDSSADAWNINLNGTDEMKPAVGYAIRAPQTFSITVPAIYQAVFKGVPNNGDYSVRLYATNYSLIGNPYPSAIDAEKFITINHNATPSVDVGSLYFWTHNTPQSGTPSAGGTYDYTSNDYAVLNSSGSTSTGAKRPDGTYEPAPSGKIASCQSFFMKASGPGVVKFTNDMRVSGSNNEFYKTTKTNELEKNRIWLNLTNTQGAFKQILVGYIEGATNEWDVNYDAATMESNSFIDFYSINQADKLCIQGRSVPFTDTDRIPLGYVTTIAGSFTIAIDQVDGLFNNQTVYLEDRTTGKATDLKAGNYTFTTAIGTFTDRFTISYTKKTLGTGDFENTENDLLVAVKEKTIKVTSTKENIKEVAIYDISGKLLYNKNKIDAAELQVQNLQSATQVLLVKITLNNEYVVTKKIIFN
jgi:hypothetical protein